MQVFIRLVLLLVIVIKLCNCGLLLEPENASGSGEGSGDIEGCDSLPCKHGGTCSPLQDDEDIYDCSCTPGYTGRNCEIEVRRNEDPTVDDDVTTVKTEVDGEQHDNCYSTAIVGSVVAVAAIVSIANIILLIIMAVIYRTRARNGPMGEENGDVPTMKHDVKTNDIESKTQPENVYEPLQTNDTQTYEELSKTDGERIPEIEEGADTEPDTDVVDIKLADVPETEDSEQPEDRLSSDTGIDENDDISSSKP